MASAGTPSTNDQAKDLILVHTVELKQMIKAQISGIIVSGDVECFSTLGENPSEEVDDDENDLLLLLLLLLALL